MFRDVNDAAGDDTRWKDWKCSETFRASLARLGMFGYSRLGPEYD